MWSVRGPYSPLSSSALNDLILHYMYFSLGMREALGEFVGMLDKCSELFGKNFIFYMLIDLIADLVRVKQGSASILSLPLYPAFSSSSSSVQAA